MLFFPEIPFNGILGLFETSQLTLACEFSFALLEFCLGEFFDKIKNDLFTVNFVVNENP